MHLPWRGRGDCRHVTIPHAVLAGTSVTDNFKQAEEVIGGGASGHTKCYMIACNGVLVSRG